MRGRLFCYAHFRKGGVAPLHGSAQKSITMGWLNDNRKGSCTGNRRMYAGACDGQQESCSCWFDNHTRLSFRIAYTGAGSPTANTDSILLSTAYWTGRNIYWSKRRQRISKGSWRKESGQGLEADWRTCGGGQNPASTDVHDFHRQGTRSINNKWSRGRNPLAFLRSSIYNFFRIFAK